MTYDIRGCRRLLRSDEGFWILVVLVDVVTDGHDELFEVFEDAAPQLVLGQVAEEAFNILSQLAEVGVK